MSKKRAFGTWMASQRRGFATSARQVSFSEFAATGAPQSPPQQQPPAPNAPQHNVAALQQQLLQQQQQINDLLATHQQNVSALSLPQRAQEQVDTEGMSSFGFRRMPNIPMPTTMPPLLPPTSSSATTVTQDSSRPQLVRPQGGAPIPPPRPPSSEQLLPPPPMSQEEINYRFLNWHANEQRRHETLLQNAYQEVPQQEDDLFS